VAVKRIPRLVSALVVASEGMIVYRFHKSYPHSMASRKAIPTETKSCLGLIAAAHVHLPPRQCDALRLAIPSISTSGCAKEVKSHRLATIETFAESVLCSSKYITFSSCCYFNQVVIFTRRGFAVPMYGFEKNTREVCTAEATLSSSARANAIKQSVRRVSMIVSMLV
jgi:hypothetical protein